MGARALPLFLGTVVCLALAVPGPAAADGLSDLGSTTISLPDVETPGVSNLDLPDVTVPSVDDVVNTVNDVSGDLTGGGDTAEPPSSNQPPSADEPSIGTPAQTAPTGDPTPAPAVATAPQAARTPPGERGGGASAAGAGVAAPAAVRPLQRRPAADEPAAPPETAPAPLIQAFQKLPWSLFAVIGGLALLGLLMSGRSASKARLASRLRRQRGELQEDVGALQSALLPAIPERIGDVALSVAYRPAEGPAAGGDFHDVMQLDDHRIAIVVGDVCGHGREALSMTALVHYTVRAYLEAGMEPREALRLADEALAEKLGGDFVTAVAAIYDAAESTLEYSTAGHPTPLIAGQPDQAVSVLTPPPIGVGLRTGLRQTRVSVPPLSRICFFTDGLVEARIGEDAMLGREGLAALLADEGGRPEAAELLDRIAAAAEASDDLTACVLAPTAATGDGTVVEELDVGRKLAAGDKLPRYLAACGLDAGEVRRAVEMTRRRVHLAGSARIRVRNSGPVPRWELTGATEPAAGGATATGADQPTPASKSTQEAGVGLSAASHR